MNINRDNYEEYFLLYADNELTDSEKVEVIMFLKQNKDLEEEFRMIHYTISKPDVNIKLADKSFLLGKGEGSFINQKNYEQVFVLYHDNELSESEKLQTEDFLSHHAQLRNEFDLIGIARLTPEDSVIFPGKRQLFRKEKTGKLIPLIFRRALVAAVLLGSGLWVTQLFIQKEGSKPAVAVGSTSVKQSAPVAGKNVLPGKKSVDSPVQSPGQDSRVAQAGIEKEKLQKPVIHKNVQTAAPAIVSVKTQKPAQENLMNQSPEKLLNNEDVIAQQKIKSIPMEQVATDNSMEPSKELAQNDIQVNKNVYPLIYTQNPSDFSEVNDNGQNYVFYDITTEEFRKTRLGGFFKKVKRVIERNNPISRLLSGDDRQVVSN